MPAILRPDYTWPRPPPFSISESTPPLPPLTPRPIRLAWGYFHTALFLFSQCYCNAFDVPFNASVVKLPFGLVMKWTDRTSIEELVAMQMARHAGMPVPRVLCCGEHPPLNANSNARFSILMTRLPGRAPAGDQADGAPWLEELKACVQAMRAWPCPKKTMVASPIGTSLRSVRVPGRIMGPFVDQLEMFDYLVSPACSASSSSAACNRSILSRANKLRQHGFRTVFTHGDFKAHNILVDRAGHLSAFLDWESAGWYPEYWEFTTAMRFARGSWWYRVVAHIGGDRYHEEIDADVALSELTLGMTLGDFH